MLHILFVTEKSKGISHVNKIRGPQAIARRSWITPSVYRRNPPALKQSSPRKNSLFVFLDSGGNLDTLWNCMKVFTFPPNPRFPDLEMQII